jgi:hypothetical protein
VYCDKGVLDTIDMTIICMDARWGASWVQPLLLMRALMHSWVASLQLHLPHRHVAVMAQLGVCEQACRWLVAVLLPTDGCIGARGPRPGRDSQCCICWLQ